MGKEILVDICDVGVFVFPEELCSRALEAAYDSWNGKGIYPLFCPGDDPRDLSPVELYHALTYCYSKKKIRSTVFVEGKSISDYKIKEY